jgi:hypothetical protein
MKSNVAALLLFLVTVTHLQGFEYGFNESFDTPSAMNAFTVYQNPSPGVGSPYSQLASGGVLGGGGVTVAAGGPTVTPDATLVRADTPFDFAKTGVPLTITTLLNILPQTAGGNVLLQLGLVNDSTSGMNDRPGFAFASLTLSSSGSSGNIYTPQFQTKTLFGEVVTLGLATNLTLEAGNWYELHGTFLNLGGGAVQASGFLREVTSDSGYGGPIIYTFPTTVFDSPDLASDTTAYAALRGFRVDGLNALDNFSALVPIPEPSSVSLVALGLGIALAHKQRRFVRVGRR